MARMPADDESPDEPGGREGDDYPQVENGEGADESDLEEQGHDRQAGVEEHARPRQQARAGKSGCGARHRAYHCPFHTRQRTRPCYSKALRSAE